MRGAPSTLRLLGCGLAALVGAFTAGCSKPLLSPDEPRSPFDRYDAVRAQHVPQYTEDKFGHRQPNLRARLEPKP